MLQNATLSPQQLTALAALLAGKSVTDAASESVVDRTTVHRWLREDFDFIAAYNGGRQEIKDAAHGRLLGLASAALDVLERALSGGATKTEASLALTLLRGLGFLSGEQPTFGSADPDTLREIAAHNKLLAENQEVARRNHEVLTRMINKPLALTVK
ncbi:MAG: hypothetical protein FJ271_19795 [Planctomycetes bacterium]|nr:hypothetical protein [Planctomycetota bacterium]